MFRQEKLFAPRRHKLSRYFYLLWNLLLFMHFYPFHYKVMKYMSTWYQQCVLTIWLFKRSIHTYDTIFSTKSFHTCLSFKINSFTVRLNDLPNFMCIYSSIENLQQYLKNLQEFYFLVIPCLLPIAHLLTLLLHLYNRKVTCKYSLCSTVYFFGISHNNINGFTR